MKLRCHHCARSPRPKGPSRRRVPPAEFHIVLRAAQFQQLHESNPERQCTREIRARPSRRTRTASSLPPETGPPSVPAARQVRGLVLVASDYFDDSPITIVCGFRWSQREALSIAQRSEERRVGKE